MLGRANAIYLVILSTEEYVVIARKLRGKKFIVVDELSLLTNQLSLR